MTGSLVLIGSSEHYWSIALYTVTITLHKSTCRVTKWRRDDFTPFNNTTPRARYCRTLPTLPHYWAQVSSVIYEPKASFAPFIPCFRVYILGLVIQRSCPRTDNIKWTGDLSKKKLNLLSTGLNSFSVPPSVVLPRKIILDREKVQLGMGKAYPKEFPLHVGRRRLWTSSGDHFWWLCGWRLLLLWVERAILFPSRRLFGHCQVVRSMNRVVSL